MEDWINLLPDPGHTRGRMTLYKQSLHLYWVMKRLMAKAMEQIAMEMAELSQGIPNLKKELKNIVITLLMQDKRLEDLQQQLEASGVLVKKEKKTARESRGTVNKGMSMMNLGTINFCFCFSHAKLLCLYIYAVVCR